jgi:nucleotide-binding universal stress UspA family protein
VTRVMRKILLAVDDSPAALEAATTAVDLAEGWGARVRAVYVAEDHSLVEAIGSASSATRTAARLQSTGRTVLGHVSRLGEERGVVVESVELEGEPYQRILEHASRWEADLVVMGRSDRRGPGSAYVGSETEQVLEFCEHPVLVVPPKAVPRPR